MDAHACRTLVFSSSAVYGFPETVPIAESAPVQPINPYGFSKAAVEQMLANLNASAPNTWRIASLRYFNPVGALPQRSDRRRPPRHPQQPLPLRDSSGRRPTRSAQGVWQRLANP